MRARRVAPVARGGRGFTLVELIVAVFLIGVGLMGLAALSTSVSRANHQSSSLTTASALAQDRLEAFRAEPYAAMASGGDTRTVDGLAYTRTWTVTEDDPEPGLKTIAVTVSWTARGRSHSTTLRTIRGSR